jgi:tRNA(fMet)-specific endonuclease VapC
VGLLIDASVLIDHERGRLDLESRVAGREDEPFFLSVITVSELLHGVHRARTPIQPVGEAVGLRRGDRRPLPAPRYRSPPPPERTRRCGPRSRSKFEPIGAHDLWIGAAALADGLTLATSNVRELRRMRALHVEDWSARGPV